MSSFRLFNIAGIKVSHEKEVHVEVEVNIAGVLTGITASAIFASVVWVIKQKLWPMYLSATYKGTKIDGDWDVFYEGKDEPSAVVT
ncbi:hypothetical protein, partial [Vibrio parahaemolyticus]|uniref:hypothetical protein n=1 Tax=Vibrio parahaemolyticus TaxID=670 RepID=UPI00112170C7